jgi:hypothetical protein
MTSTSRYYPSVCEISGPKIRNRRTALLNVSILEAWRNMITRNEQYRQGVVMVLEGLIRVHLCEGDAFTLVPISQAQSYPCLALHKLVIDDMYGL